MDVISLPFPRHTVELYDIRGSASIGFEITPYFGTPHSDFEASRRYLSLSRLEFFATACDEIVAKCQRAFLPIVDTIA